MSQTTLPERVLEWTKTYCDSLTENYKQHSVRMYQGSDSDYSKKQLENAGLTAEAVTELGNDPESLEARLIFFSIIELILSLASRILITFLSARREIELNSSVRTSGFVIK